MPIIQPSVPHCAHRSFSLLCGTALMAIAPVVASAQAPVQLSGTFAPELVERPGISPTPFSPAWPSDRRRLPAPLAAGERAYIGVISLYDYSDSSNKIVKRLPAMVVTSATAPTVLYASLTGDTIFTLKDRHVLAPRTTGVGKIREGDKEVWLSYPIPKGTVFSKYPIHLIESPEAAVSLLQFRKQTADDVYYLWEPMQVAQGTVTVNGKPANVQFSVSPLTGKVLTVGNYGMDCDGDGKIDARSKTENVYRRTAKDPVVFKTGGTYWEPLRVDDATGKFVMEQRTEADYAFLDLSVGAVMPDFSFVTLDGKTRKLSEYRGKYVLLDVWSTGCIPCREEMPILKTAYSTYGPRGFEILGLDTDENLDQLHRFLKEKGITWTQTSTATPGSGTKLETLINKQLRVTGIPTAILIGPDGKILSMGNPNEPRLRGSDFLETLEKLLPAPKTTTE